MYNDVYNNIQVDGNFLSILYLTYEMYLPFIVIIIKIANQDDNNVYIVSMYIYKILCSYYFL